MSIRNKIVLSFAISAFLIGALLCFEFVDYVQLRHEISYLELTDTIRSKTLQLRRHEKNFFLYSPQQSASQSAEVHSYLDQLGKSLSTDVAFSQAVASYRDRFDKIEKEVPELYRMLDDLKVKAGGAFRVFPLAELAVTERPLDLADALDATFNLPADAPVLSGLRDLDTDIRDLRKNGEDLISLSREMDQRARAKAEALVGESQAAILLLFPLFVAVGLGTLFFITNRTTVRLKALEEFIDKAGTGVFVPVPEEGPKDEVGTLINKFNLMEKQLMDRGRELERKNRELFISRKLAAVGTLASGIAHEINNPLNNIYLSAQVLGKGVNEQYPPEVLQAISDIKGQTARVKRIVSDLLEFAKGREPESREVDLAELAREAYSHAASAVPGLSSGVEFKIESSGEPKIRADYNQMERVFINLFTNALDAMNGMGKLNVKVYNTEDEAVVEITDSGPGITPENIDKIFEPFFTTKDTGTGLGLPIAFNIIKRHGGNLEAISAPGAGTTFKLEFTVEGK